MLEIIKNSPIYQDLIEKSAYKEYISSFILGFSIGYFLKKSIKLMFFILIIFLALLLYFDNSFAKELNIDFNSFSAVGEVLSKFASYLENRVSNLSNSIIISIFIGIIVGLKVG